MSGLQERARERAYQFSGWRANKGEEVLSTTDALALAESFECFARAEVVRVLEEAARERCYLCAMGNETMSSPDYLGGAEYHRGAGLCSTTWLRILADKYREGGAAPEEKTT